MFETNYGDKFLDLLALRKAVHFVVRQFLLWNETTFVCNETTFLWNETTMERNDRIPQDQHSSTWVTSTQFSKKKQVVFQELFGNSPLI